MAYSAIKLANEMIEIAKQDGRQLTPLQLIKLVYISHGWGFVFRNGEPLLNEPVQAWQYGPVVPSLYHAVRNYRSAPITGLVPGDSDPQALDDHAKELLKVVYNRYRHLSGTQLSALTHMEDTPWSKAWNERGKNAVIDNAEVAKHYKKRFAELSAK